MIKPLAEGKAVFYEPNSERKYQNQALPHLEKENRKKNST